MIKFLFLSMGSVLLIASAHAEFEPGVYEHRHEVSVQALMPLLPYFARTRVLEFRNEADCKLKGGESWRIEGDEAYCIFNNAKDIIRIFPAPEGGLRLTVKTVGNNMTTCLFEANATELDADRLTARDGACQVTVQRSVDKKSVSVQSSGNATCLKFCGVFASLDIENAEYINGP